MNKKKSSHSYFWRKHEVLPSESLSPQIFNIVLKIIFHKDFIICNKGHFTYEINCNLSGSKHFGFKPFGYTIKTHNKKGVRQPFWPSFIFCLNKRFPWSQVWTKPGFDLHWPFTIIRKNWSLHKCGQSRFFRFLQLYFR